MRSLRGCCLRYFNLPCSSTWSRPPVKTCSSQLGAVTLFYEAVYNPRQNSTFWLKWRFCFSPFCTWLLKIGRKFYPQKISTQIRKLKAPWKYPDPASFGALDWHVSTRRLRTIHKLSWMEEFTVTKYSFQKFTLPTPFHQGPVDCYSKRDQSCQRKRPVDE